MHRVHRAFGLSEPGQQFLCFPFIFRGALDVGATAINEPMKSPACALAELAQAEQSDVVAAAYGDERRQFGPDYLIPTPFDPRLIRGSHRSCEGRDG